VLSRAEQQIWEDVERFWADEAEEPVRPGGVEPRRATHAPGDEEDVPLAVAAGVRLAIVLVLFGAVGTGVALAAACAVGWALWRSWSQRGEDAVLPSADPDASEEASP
jgi:hypothetical protein